MALNPEDLKGLSLQKTVRIHSSKRLKSSSMRQSLVEACRMKGVELDWTRLKGLEDFMDSPHMITWGIKVDPNIYAHRTDVLYIENGLLKQDAGMWTDNRGWFSRSDLCLNREFDEEPAPEEIAKLEEHCRKYFEWDLFEGGNPNGPILHATQTTGDATVQFHFSRLDQDLGPRKTVMIWLKKHLPNHPLLVRPHPKTNRWKRGGQTSFFRDNWSINSPETPVYELLKTCSALTTINSTLATEALSLGIPVATLGESTFTGSGATLECAENPSLLQSIRDWKPDKEKVVKYLCAVLRHQISYEATREEVQANQCFQKWIGQIG